jgi:SAM-dependent methyltransferase
MESAVVTSDKSSVAVQAASRENAHSCYLCGASFFRFIPFRGGVAARPALMNLLDVVDCDLDRFFCPVCGCHGRERHLHMYFDALDLWKTLPQRNILHFGPYEKKLVQRIMAFQPRHYVRADLYPPSADVEEIDVTHIQYADNYFDFILCCHVLEHVPDDARALSELYRVLKPGGYAILQTPFSRVLHKSWEDDGIAKTELQQACYGQENHVRLYGIDLFAKIEAAGFTLDLQQHGQCLEQLSPAYYGVNGDEELILAGK